MSVQTNQYLMYGISLPADFIYKWQEKTGEDFYDKYDEFMNDSAFNKTIVEKDGITILADGMSGKYIIVGKVIEKGDDEEPFVADRAPFPFDEMPQDVSSAIAESIKRNLGVEGEMKYWLITHYR